MKLIVGLGNPGEKYKQTRHNAGFMALDFLLNDNDGFMTAKESHEFKSIMHTWQSQNGEKVIFLKPQTYMNDSGQALKVICNFYKMNLPHELLVVHDEADLPFGSIRLAKSSSAAGHNGVKSIIENLGTQNFFRIRIGIETRTAPKTPSTDEFVLQNFSPAEVMQLNAEILPKVKTEIEKFIGLAKK